MTSSQLDHAVFPAVAFLKERDWRTPSACLLLGTGQGQLLTHWTPSASLPLYEVAETPAAWHEVTLHAVDVEGQSIWILEDAPGPLQFGGGAAMRPAWERAYPVWLAAASGAKVLLHTSAGIGLHEKCPVGALAFACDHINFSGGTPLLGLGDTRLGPLFPDQTNLHHAGLRLQAQAHALALGLGTAEEIAACTPGPNLATRAELDWLASTPARYAVQNAAGPWIAAAHAGLSLLAITAICDERLSPQRMPQVLETMDQSAGAIDDLILRLAPDIAQLARELEEEI